MNQRILLLSCLFSLLSAGVGLADAPRPERANVILLLADDLGWQDVKCYDIDEPTPMETPHLDRLATKGVQFWQAYSPAPVCAPSRAAILSGLHPARGEMTSVAGGSPPHPHHPSRAETIAPWYSARMPVATFTLAEALKAEGYVTGHSGKWHISQHHYAYPNPFHHGFDQSTHHRGVQTPMKPDRLTGFATTAKDDPYRLDKNGFPFDVPQDAAMTFIQENQDQPFFLYYASWLVHAPIVMRSEALLQKYEKKLGVTLTEEHKKNWKTPGQTNPFYCAMVEQLDYYFGQIFSYLETTADPRWPGHMLSENTYIIFTSDNGGMEGGGHEIYTDNYPLDRGKISTKEGGVRVPLIITGPGIRAGVQSDVVVNGLDFYPTILSLIGASEPEGKHLDGCDLTPLLKENPKDAKLVRDAAGKVRDTLVWHFPQMENTASIRVGDYKLIRRFHDDSRQLYRLYNTDAGSVQRGDIEEKHDLAAAMPEMTKQLDAKLSAMVSEMGGRTPYYNPKYFGELPHKEKAPTVISCEQRDRRVHVRFKDNGAKIAFADLLYSQNGGNRMEEWQRVSAISLTADEAVFELPVQTSHYFVNLIDENHFLVDYPEIDEPKRRKESTPFSAYALAAGYPQPGPGAPLDLNKVFGQLNQADASVQVLLSESFEDPTALVLKSSGAGVSVVDTIAATGRRCLHLLDEAGLEREWMPLVDQGFEIPAAWEAGTFRLAFDLMLDQEAPGVLSVMLRDQRENAAEILVGKGLTVDGLAATAIEAGVWYHVDFSYRFGAAADWILTVTVTAADGRTASSEFPLVNRGFRRATMLGLAGLGAVGSRVYIDSLVVRVEE